MTSRQHEQALEKVESERSEFIERKEQEFAQVILSEKAKMQQEKAKNHAEATQQLYDEIHATLKEKFTLDSKCKVQEISKQMRESMEAKLKELT